MNTADESPEGQGRSRVKSNNRSMRSPAVLVGMVLLAATSVHSQEPANPQPNRDDAETGTIEGVVIYESDRKRPWRYRRYYVADRKKGHLAEALVGLTGKSVTGYAATARPDRWTIDQKDYRFIPETLAVRAGDQITFTNSDPHVHDVTIRQLNPSSREISRQDSFTLGQREEVSRTYNDAGGTGLPLTLSCRFHGAMRGWIYVFDHPLFDVTEKSGEFRLDRIPAGKHQLMMVHPAGNLQWEQAIEVRVGETRRMEIRVSPDNLIVVEE